MSDSGSSRADASPLAAYEDQRVVVLGATGFIGRWVARALVRRHARVQVFARDGESGERLCTWLGRDRAQLVRCDLADFAAVQAALRGIRPAVVFNLAGYGIDRSERDETMSVLINAQLVEAVCKVMAEARDAGWTAQAVVHAGSASEYGQDSDSLREDSPTRPVSLYGRSKLAGTLALAQNCRSLDLPGLTARLFMVYGAGEHSRRLFPLLLQTARTRQPLALTDGRQRLDFTYVEDVAEGMLRLGVSRAAAGSIVNLATGTLTSVRVFVETAARILDIPSELLNFGSQPPRPDEMKHGPVLTDRLRSLTGWTPGTTIADGIRRTLEHSAVMHGA